MAWLARSIANSLKLDEDDDDVEKPRPGDDESAQNQSCRSHSLLEELRMTSQSLPRP
ncbi:hypothetical protein Bca4012_020762 [Brassica carinata]